MGTDYTRCPLCGKLAREDSLAIAEDEGHELQTASCEIGGRGHCAWTFENLDADEAIRLADLAGRVAQRLAEYAGEAPHWVRVDKATRCADCGTWLAGIRGLKVHRAKMHGSKVA